MTLHHILLLGSGGRESALAWKLRQSPLCGNLFIAPGNAGTGAYGTNLPIGVTDFDGIRAACLEHGITMVVVGPEDPLVAGIWDFFQADASLRHILVVGPSKEGAQLEGSKAHAKKFMARHGIPTAAYREFTRDSFDEGVAYLKAQAPPIVLKADGLAAGKGVVIAASADEAIEAFSGMLREERFGTAGHTVVVEQFLKGTELSVFAFTDGRDYVVLPEAKDYKRIGEGDSGLNTGGMGAVSPVPFAEGAFLEKVRDRIVTPTIRGLASENIPYVGFVFFGLIEVGGEPYVIEYNCRMGDPETEAVLPRLDADLVALFAAAGAGTLAEMRVAHAPQATATVMLVSAGYPGSYEKGRVMNGLQAPDDTLLFHAGTGEKDGAVVTAGGRVLAITGQGKTLQEALEKAYSAAEDVSYDGKYYRRDIGHEFV